MKAYNGEAPCPGCGKPGSESWRFSVKDNCHSCRDLLKLGAAAKLQMVNESGWVNISVNQWSVWDSQSGEGKILWESFKGLLENIFNKSKTSLIHENLGDHSHNRVVGVVTKEQFLAIKNLYVQFPKSIRAVSDAGKNEGSSLLMSLHKGDITLDKFNERLK